MFANERGARPGPPIPDKTLVTPPRCCSTALMVAARFTNLGSGRLPVPRPAGGARRGAGARPRHAGLDDRLAQRSEPPRHARRPSLPGPRPPVHPHQQPPRREQQPEPEDLQVSISSIILDRNSQVCLHKRMEPQPITEMNRARGRARSSSQLHCSASQSQQ